MSTLLHMRANVSTRHDRVVVTKTWTKAAAEPPGMDASAFVLGESGSVLSDDHFLFYNQNTTPDGGVSWQAASVGGNFTLEFTLLPAEAVKVIIVTTVDGLPKPLSAYALTDVAIMTGSTPVARFPADLSRAAGAELILRKFCRRDGRWRFRAVAQGLNGGLAALARQYGVDVNEKPTTPVRSLLASPAGALTQTTVLPTAEAPAPNVSKRDLRKQKLGVIMEEKGFGGIRVNIGAIMDRSGSMSGLYARGVVQDTFERVVPVAMRLAPVEKVDTWFFASQSRKTPDCTPANLDGYVERHAPPHGGLFWRGDGIGFGNNEACCMQDVIQHYTTSHTPALPTMVLFFHDGGVTDSAGITRVMKEASSLPLFWQFVGLGKGSFTILERLDSMSGRVVDNCKFFRMPTITRMSDEQLYEQFLAGFSIWLAAAHSKGIVR